MVTYHLVFIFNVDVVDAGPCRWRAYLLRVVLICGGQLVIVSVSFSGHFSQSVFGVCLAVVVVNKKKTNNKSRSSVNNNNSSSKNRQTQ